jgi:hypothetical protein
MMRRFLTTITIAALVSGFVGAPVLAQQQQNQTLDGGGFTVPFTTTGTNNGGTVDVTGTFTIDKFANRAGQLVALGTLVATVRDNNTVRTVVTTAAVPVSAINHGAPTVSGVITPAATCGILHLELGPLDLDLLGLVVHLDRVVLDISAESGPGNLLGNLLCGIAGLLDSGPLAGIINQLVNALNLLLAAL